jgi:ABC-2 type transport system ATP-binding protein
MRTTDKSAASVKGLTKDFGNGKGVFDVSFAVQPGEIVGFVGPNGAGKSTTINAITGLIKPDSGTFSLFGHELNQVTIHTVLRKVGIMYSEPTLEESKTARQIFDRTAALLGKDCTETWQEMSRQFDLDVDKKVKKLSLGNKKKVQAIRALMHNPELIIMDEPTSGLDPIVKDSFMDLLRTAAQNGASVLLSSHDLTEVQHVSSRIIMIKSGKVILDDNTANILNQSVRLFRLIDPPAEFAHTLNKLSFINDLRKQGNDLTLQTAEYIQLIQLLGDKKFYNYFVEQPSLEDTFKEKYE